MIAAFQSVPRLLACPHLLLRFVREAVARRLSSRKKLERLPAFEVDIEIEALKEPGLGKGMLEVISKLTSPPSSIDFDSDFNSTSQAYSVFVDQPAAIADVIALHAVRPGLAERCTLRLCAWKRLRCSSCSSAPCSCLAELRLPMLIASGI